MTMPDVTLKLTLLGRNPPPGVRDRWPIRAARKERKMTWKERIAEIRKLPPHSADCETFVNKTFGLYDKTCPRCAGMYGK